MATFNLQPHFPPVWYKGSLFPYSTREQWLLLCRWRLFSNNESAVQAKTPASLHEPFSNLIWVKQGESETRSWRLKYQGGFSLILGGFGLLDKQPRREAGLRVIVALAFLFTMRFNNNALPFIKVTHSKKKNLLLSFDSAKLLWTLVMKCWPERRFESRQDTTTRAWTAWPWRAPAMWRCHLGVWAACETNSRPHERVMKEKRAMTYKCIY